MYYGAIPAELPIDIIKYALHVYVCIYLNSYLYSIDFVKTRKCAFHYNLMIK